MASVVIINPAGISAGDAQTVNADLTKFDFAKEQVGLVVEKLTPFVVIHNDEQLNAAMEALVVGKTVEKAIEEKRKHLVKPFNDGAGKINDYKKELVGDLQEKLEQVKAAVLQYQKDQEKKAKQARTVVRQGQVTELGFEFNASANHYKLDGIGSVTSVEIENYEDAGWNAILNGFISQINNRNLQKLEDIKQESDLTNAFGSDSDKQQLQETITAAATPVKVNTVSTYAPVSKVKGQTKKWDFTVNNANAIPREYLMVDETLIRQAIREGVRNIPGVDIFEKDGLSIKTKV